MRMPKHEQQPADPVGEPKARVTLEISLRPGLAIEDLAALNKVAERRGQSVEQIVVEALRGVLADVAA